MSIRGEVAFSMMRGWFEDTSWFSSRPSVEIHNVARAQNGILATVIDRRYRAKGVCPMGRDADRFEMDG